NITQTIECDHSPSERFLAPLGMTTLLLNGSSIASHKIDNCEWRIQSEEEKQRDAMQMQEVRRPRLGEKTQNGKRIGNRQKKAEESPIWKTKTQVWREHSLQRAANSPEICNLEPALISRPHRHDYDHHAPVAHLHGQHMPPIHDAVAADKNQISDVVQDQHR